MSNQKFYTYLARRALFHAQGGICHICGGRLPRRYTSPASTLDHVWPQALMVLSSYELHKFLGNVLLAHDHCNTRKGDRLPTGCERIMLFLANRRLGLEESMTGQFDGRAPRFAA